MSFLFVLIGKRRPTRLERTPSMPRLMSFQPLTSRGTRSTSILPASAAKSVSDTISTAGPTEAGLQGAGPPLDRLGEDVVGVRGGAGGRVGGQLAPRRRGRRGRRGPAHQPRGEVQRGVPGAPPVGTGGALVHRGRLPRL